MGNDLLFFGEKILFALLYTGFLAVLLALVVRANNSTRRTKLILPRYARVGLIIEVMLIAGSIIFVLLA